MTTKTFPNSDPLLPSQEQSLWQPGVHCTHLDGVRGLAILVVTLYRFTKEMPVESWLGSTLHVAFGFGNRGVDLFFVLSGFLITGVLLQAKGLPNFFGGFYWRRALRIFPLYFVTLAVLLVIVPAFGPAEAMPPELEQARSQQFYLWTYTSNIQMALTGSWCFGAMDHFWSLAVEEHFYFLWPLIVFAFPIRRVLVVAIGLAAFSSMSRILMSMVSDNGVATDVFTLFRMDGLCMGAALAIVAREFPWVLSNRRWLLTILLLLFVLSSALSFSGKGLWTIPHTCWAVTWTIAIAALLVSPLESSFAKLFNIGLLRNLGRYSYAMYVFQCPQIPIFASLLSVGSLSLWLGNGIVATLIYAAVMTAINYILAVASWNLLEKHCLKMKSYFWHPSSRVRSSQSPQYGPKTDGRSLLDQKLF